MEPSDSDLLLETLKFRFYSEPDAIRFETKSEVTESEYQQAVEIAKFLAIPAMGRA